MTDRYLISKLNNLKNVKPEASWLESNRELLLTQISNSGASQLSAWQTFIINLQSFTKVVYQPAVVLGAFVVVLVFGGLFSHQLFTQAKPNDSLYIARIISEKAKLGTIFNTTERDRLAVQFATNHAQDITAVLADPEFNNENNQVEVARLNESFNKEIDTVKTKIGRLAGTRSEVKTVAALSTNNDDAVVSIASDLTDDQGIQLSENKPIITEIVLENTSQTEEIISDISEEEAEEVKEVEETEETTDTDKILDEAKQLFEQKDYNSALNKLKEVNEIIK